MLYAASEIVFWILLAAVVGGGIGYGFSEAKSLRLDKRLNDSKAHAPMERELAIAWDTIEDLNRRLKVAHETIRGVDGEELEEFEELGDVEAPTVVADGDSEPAVPDDNGVVGTRLSQRVASASAANKAAKPEVSD